MTNILKCRIENILGVKEVEFAPDGKSVVIGGGNGQGKSSAIWALTMALGGKSQMPPQPVRSGQEHGEVIVETDRFNVTLVFDQTGKSKLEVRSKDGAKYSSPQTLLNECFGHLSFEPGAFIHMDKAARLKTLRELVGVDLSDLDKKEAELYELRRDCGYAGKTLAGKAEGVVYNENLPSDEVQVSELLEELRLAEEKVAANLKTCEYMEGLNDVVENLDQEIEEAEEALKLLKKSKKAVEEERAEFKKKYDKLENVDLDPIKDKIGRSSEVNAKIKANREAKVILEELQKARSEYKDLDDQIVATRDEKLKRLESAKFPIEGLSFTEEGVTFKGIPFEQISESEQWEISTAIGFALNPKGVLFVRNSGGLDKRSRERVRARATELGVQLFMEVVDDAEDVQILIEEGEVKENRLKGE